MQVKAVMGEDVTAMKFEEAMQEAEAERLEITFLLGEKELTVPFSKAPLGISFFAAKAPLVISSFPEGSQAVDLGLEIGMQVKAVMGEDVTAMKFEEALKMIQVRCETLSKA